MVPKYGKKKEKKYPYCTVMPSFGKQGPQTYCTQEKRPRSVGDMDDGDDEEEEEDEKGKRYSLGGTEGIQRQSEKEEKKSGLQAEGGEQVAARGCPGLDECWQPRCWVSEDADLERDTRCLQRREGRTLTKLSNVMLITSVKMTSQPNEKVYSQILEIIIRVVLGL